MLSRLPSPVGCLGERFIFKKWTKSLQALSSAVQFFYCQSHVHPALFPPFLHSFALFFLRERLFNSNTEICWLAWTIHANWNPENCSVLFLKRKKEIKVFSFFPFEIPNGMKMRHSEASYHLCWRICSALLSSLFHHLHLSSIIIMELVDIEMKLPGIDSRIAEERSVSMTFSSFWGQGAWAGVGGGREGWRLGRDAC